GVVELTAHAAAGARPGRAGAGPIARPRAGVRGRERGGQRLVLGARDTAALVHQVVPDLRVAGERALADGLAIVAPRAARRADLERGERGDVPEHAGAEALVPDLR